MLKDRQILYTWLRTCCSFPEVSVTKIEKSSHATFAQGIVTTLTGLKCWGGRHVTDTLVLF